MSRSDALSCRCVRSGPSSPWDAVSRIFSIVQNECHTETSIPVGIQPKIAATSTMDPAGKLGTTRCVRASGPGMIGTNASTVARASTAIMILLR